MHSTRKLFLDFRPRLAAHATIGVLAVSTQFTAVALAATPSDPGRTPATSEVTCSTSSQQAGVCAMTTDGLQVDLPGGTHPCPSSGEAAACTAEPAGQVATGVASTPDGMTACPSDATAPIAGSPAACNDPQTSNGGLPVVAPTVAPSVPISSLQPAAATQKLSLRADRTSAPADGAVVLTASAGAGYSAVGVAIEIFDSSTGALLGACAHGPECSVAYSAKAGLHDFTAYLTTPTATAPIGSPAVSSNRVTVGWTGVQLASVNSVVGPGKSVLVTATSSIPVERFGYAIEIFDAGSGNRITYCSQGTTCTVSMTQQSSGSRSIVAALGKATPKFSSADFPAVSGALPVTWVSVSMGGTSVFQVGGVIHLTATASADLTNTPWSIGLFDDQGHLVGKPCKTGASCSADVTVPASATPHYFAAIGSEPSSGSNKIGELFKRVTGPITLTNIQARSAPVQPARVLWGVDSCKALTGDQSGKDLYSDLLHNYGAPDFWGRYLTSTVCSPLGQQEVALAARNHFGILPIYNEADCSQVSGYDTGRGYAQEATGAAAAAGIPAGRGIAVDIEPSGGACPGAANVDAGFLHGWYDGVRQAGYVPIYYGNGTAGSEFGSAWCQAQSENPAMATEAFIWSFEPSYLRPGMNKTNAPSWQPFATGCPDFVAAWQFHLGDYGPNFDVDHDLALSVLPLWYPS